MKNPKDWGVACPHCGDYETSVIDSRPKELRYIRRRRQCDHCRKRFNTYEAVGDKPLRQDEVERISRRMKTINAKLEKALSLVEDAKVISA